MYVRILLYISPHTPHTAIYVSSYCNTLILQHMCPHTATPASFRTTTSRTSTGRRTGGYRPAALALMSIPQRSLSSYEYTTEVSIRSASSYEYTTEVSAYCYMCLRILLYMCPHTAIYVSAYCYMCPHASCRRAARAPTSIAQGLMH